jgi:hypothetical protein
MKKSLPPAGMRALQPSILRTLLYYDIFDFPLTSREIFDFLTINTVTPSKVQSALDEMVREKKVETDRGFYFLPGKPYSLAILRSQREKYAKRLWSIARIVAQVLRQFPFVRAVLVSGGLSKNVADRESDIDLFLVTERGRLWICRTFLVLFKKLFLLNKKKYFCINHFVTVDHLEVVERNIYIASEVAHVQPLFNLDLFERFVEANRWVKEYFPNFRWDGRGKAVKKNRTGALQRILELPFRGRWADALDRSLMELMEKIWRERYSHLDENVRERIFLCKPYESRAHAGNFEDKVLKTYNELLQRYGIDGI